MSKGPFHIHVDDIHVDANNAFETQTSVSDQGHRSSYRLERFQKDIRYIKTELGNIPTVEKQQSKHRISWILG